MKQPIYLGMALALGLIASPGLAQPSSDQTHRDRTMNNVDSTTRHDSDPA